ncbi:MAG: hypothetical protein GWN01_09920 [Nitrosopumilaceae archaeon]|nr:hypothetical protein [Nitrosopumilaceae archaeon]NIU87576.1 hypothetical protein [Nitrosopumilaceae archaeon]NIX61824.1 hypothetical protein [Nitrosopumilaceae archaeon]
MTVDSLLRKLENGKKVTTPKNGSLITVLQATIDSTYSKFSVNVDVNDKMMTFERVRDFEYKAEAE